jgi:coenzyme F420-reducing hydrogenase gamma subunit
MKQKKLRIGFFSLTCCEGCELAVFETNQDFLKALGLVEIVESRMLREKNPPTQMDIAFVEGAIVGKNDLEKAQKIRERSKFLVAIGACATIAGIPGLRNALPAKVQSALPQHAIKQPMAAVHRLSDFVKTDFELQGCAISQHEFLKILIQFYHGFVPRLEDVPVCKECKELENPCLLLKGIACLGPVSYAGCNALCPTQNAQCIACRGFTKDANFSALKDLFREFGLVEHEIKNLFTYFNPDPFKKEVPANAR